MAPAQSLHVVGARVVMAWLGRMRAAITPRPAVATRLVFVSKALIMVSLLATVAVLIVRARTHRLEHPRHLVDLAVWSVAERPDWSRLEDVAQIRDASGVAGRGLPLYDRDAAEIVREALEATPRALRVVSMRRLLPASIEVVLEMRRPAAAVAIPGGRWVEVDGEGVVLAPPVAERPVRDGLPLRVVAGGDVPPNPGEVCPADVRAGIELCTQLDAYRDGLGVRILRAFDEVDVTNHGGRVDAAESEIVLRAAPLGPDSVRPIACAVEWGRVDALHGEPPFEAKAGRLERAIAVFGEFEGVARVRVAFDDGLTVLPVDGPDGAWLPALAEQSLGR